MREREGEMLSVCEKHNFISLCPSPGRCLQLLTVDKFDIFSFNNLRHSKVVTLSESIRNAKTDSTQKL